MSRPTTISCAPPCRPVGRDVEFPANWKELSARRLKGVQLSAKEKAIIEALDKPTTVNWTNTMLEEALQELSTQMNQNLFIDKKSLSDLGIELNKPTTLRATGVSIRTVLRQILAAQGLTFVVKDESIQVVTVEKARDLLVTRVYYLGDLVQSTGPFGGAPQWGPFIDYQQTMANVETIVKSITKSVDPLSWREAGGAGDGHLPLPEHVDHCAGLDRGPRHLGRQDRRRAVGDWHAGHLTPFRASLIHGDRVKSGLAADVMSTSRSRLVLR